MIVPDKWWREYSGDNPNPAKIVGYDPEDSRYFYFSCDTDNENLLPYKIRYDCVKEYADPNQEDFHKYHLPAYDVVKRFVRSQSHPPLSTSAQPGSAEPSSEAGSNASAAPRVSLSPEMVVKQPLDNSSLALAQLLDSTPAPSLPPPAPGLVSRLDQPLVSKLDNSDPLHQLYLSSLDTYDRMKLMSHKCEFEGAVFGPLCLYLGARPGQENDAETCLRDLDETYLSKVTFTKHADLSKVRDEGIPMKVYLITGPFDKEIPVPPELAHYGLDSISAAHPIVFNVLFDQIARFEEADRHDASDNSNVNFDLAGGGDDVDSNSGDDE